MSQPSIKCFYLKWHLGPQRTHSTRHFIFSTPIWPTWIFSKTAWHNYVGTTIFKFQWTSLTTLIPSLKLQYSILCPQFVIRNTFLSNFIQSIGGSSKWIMYEVKVKTCLLPEDNHFEGDMLWIMYLQHTRTCVFLAYKPLVDCKVAIGWNWNKRFLTYCHKWCTISLSWNRLAVNILMKSCALKDYGIFFNVNIPLLSHG